MFPLIKIKKLTIEKLKIEKLKIEKRAIQEPLRIFFLSVFLPRKAMCNTKRCLPFDAAALPECLETAIAIQSGIVR